MIRSAIAATSAALAVTLLAPAAQAGAPGPLTGVKPHHHYHCFAQGTIAKPKVVGYWSKGDGGFLFYRNAQWWYGLDFHYWNRYTFKDCR